jgi:hypothetical protein
MTSAMTRERRDLMRSMTRSVLLSAGLILLAAVGTAHASPMTVLKANVPFAFTVNGHNFPAGKYMIEQDDMSPSILLIRGDSKNAGLALVATRPDGGQDPAGSKPALAFKRFENQYRLNAVWESASDGRDVISR